MVDTGDGDTLSHQLPEISLEEDGLQQITISLMPCDVQSENSK